MELVVTVVSDGGQRSNSSLIFTPEPAGLLTPMIACWSLIIIRVIIFSNSQLLSIGESRVC